MAKEKERRRSPRTASTFPLHVRLIPVNGSDVLDAEALDLSPEGVRFRCAGGVHARSGLLLELLLPGGRPVRTFGRTAWVRELPDGTGIEVGGCFVDQSTSVRITIDHHLKGVNPPAKA